MKVGKFRSRFAVTSRPAVLSIMNRMSTLREAGGIQVPPAPPRPPLPPSPVSLSRTARPHPASRASTGRMTVACFNVAYVLIVCSASLLQSMGLGGRAEVGVGARTGCTHRPDHDYLVSR